MMGATDSKAASGRPRALSKSIGDDGCRHDLAPVSDEEAKRVEQAISACVADFYGQARNDALLGPVFNGAVADWDVHLKIVADFWSHALLKTERYKGFPFPVHTQLPLKPEHFPRWLELFEVSARKILPPEFAEAALARAQHMARSFMAGVFPFTDKDGKPARRPG
ncbi:globin family protein [Methylocella silvestris BL2]|uniref:Globin family protein n=1 Tax=Methylocella silvestris (strain DSM 15510 / CIP 108128 / LMG 27833 / NCIMB 13906 / BL2) TaxID=395965 RepID=B8EM49_METSB|nr:group III truncated hemoglobin [Methylocella silvestris]ACK51438.1 globin family protein [Methylocella silvestris BL2]